MRPGHCASSFLTRTTGWLSFSRAWHCGATTLFVAVALASAAPVSHADENGISFWVPGFFGSLAATPQQPGWSLVAMNYYTNVSASGDAALSREISLGQFNPALNASINANVRAHADIGFFAPTYVFATPFLGGQASATLLMAYGQNSTGVNGTLSGALGPIPFTRTVSLDQTTTGVGDLVPQFAVRWNAGVNNYMAYLTGDIPVGDYSSNNLANTSASGTAPSMAASATRFSIQSPAMNFRQWPD